MSHNVTHLALNSHTLGEALEAFCPFESWGDYDWPSLGSALTAYLEAEASDGRRCLDCGVSPCRLIDPEVG